MFDKSSLFSENDSMRTGMLKLFPWMGFAYFLSSCAIIFPDRTAPKSFNYKVDSLPAAWKKLQANEDLSLNDAMKADLAFENQDTGAIISLNSICRKYQSSSLEALTNNLVRGIANRKTLSSKLIKISDIDALESVFSGLVDNVDLTIETIVLKKESCTYDFIFVVSTDKTASSSGDFKKFVASFRVEQ